MNQLIYQNRHQMSTTQIKETLHLRIEQADEKMLRVFAQLMETMFSEYQPEAFTSETNVLSDAPPWAKPMTKEESLTDIREGLEEYRRGEYKTLEEIEKASQKW